MQKKHIDYLAFSMSLSCSLTCKLGIMENGGWGMPCAPFCICEMELLSPPLPSQSKESNRDSTCETALSPLNRHYLAIMYPHCKPGETSLWDFWQPHFWSGVKRIKIIIPSIPKTRLPFSQTLMIPALGWDSILLAVIYSSQREDCTS